MAKGRSRPKQGGSDEMNFCLADELNLLHHEHILLPVREPALSGEGGPLTTSINYVSLEEEAALALRGAASRLAKANSDLADFLAEPWRSRRPRHGRASLMREYHALLVERDDSMRPHSKAQFDLAQFKRGR